MYHQPAYHQPAYVDANGPCVGVDRHAVSASSSYLPYNYEHEPVEDHFSNPLYKLFDDYLRIKSSSHASASPDQRPMNNVGYLIDQHGTPLGQEDVSRLYPSVADSQYAGSSPNRPMDGGIGYASASYLAGYP